MKPNNKVIAVGLCAMLVFGGHVFAADETTITGALYASAWDDNANPTAVVIMNEDGDFAVVNDAIGQQLLELAGKDVQVNGVMEEDNKGRRKIRVLRYTLMTD
jgi:hypothetical protein